MLLILIFISQTVFANPPIPVMPPVKFNDRALSKQADDLNIKAACDVAYSFNMISVEKCVKQYNEEKAFFRKEMVDFCQSHYDYFSTMKHKTKCIDMVKNKTFNMSALNSCLEKAKQQHRGNLNDIDSYVACLNSKNNLAGVNGFESSPGKSGHR